METLHSKDESPFVVRDRGDEPVATHHVECPVETCGKPVLLTEADFQIKLHSLEQAESEASDHASDTQPGTSREAHKYSTPLGHERFIQAAAAIAPRLSVDDRYDRYSHPNTHPGRDNWDHRGDEGWHHRTADLPVAPSGRPQKAQPKVIQIWKRILQMPCSSSSSDPSTPETSSTPPRQRQRQREREQEREQERERTGTPTSLPEFEGKRLGKAQLGKYADEDCMPTWLISHLQTGGQVRSEGVIPVLAQLLDQSPSTEYAYLCDESVQHVSKLRKEGAFCGYRNIQMLVSYVYGVEYRGHQHFDKKLPSIFQIQDFIETAWDNGIGSHGRVETGGIRFTRKYIGTPEALAMFRLLKIPCKASGFQHQDAAKAEAMLLDDIEHYFRSGLDDRRQRVRQTKLGPIYLQHAGHSMTVIGLERCKQGTRNLLVFDPMFRDAASIKSLIGREFRHSHADLALRAYRRGTRYLKGYKQFEIIKLPPIPSPDVHWDSELGLVG